MLNKNCKKMPKYQTYEEKLFSEAYQDEQAAQFRRKFPTNKKLLLNPSEEMCEKYTEYLMYAADVMDSERALIWPTMELEDQYGYIDGVPKEQLRDKEEKVCAEEVCAEEEDEDAFEWVWNKMETVKSQSKDDYDLLMTFGRWSLKEFPTNYHEAQVNNFLTSIDWKVFRGYIMEEK